MSRLQEIKDDYARGLGYSNFEEVVGQRSVFVMESTMDEVARRYATAMTRHNLERAADKARTEWIPDDNPKFGHYGDDVIVKESITGIEIELI